MSFCGKIFFGFKVANFLLEKYAIKINKIIDIDFMITLINRHNVYMQKKFQIPCHPRLEALLLQDPAKDRKHLLKLQITQMMMWPIQQIYRNQKMKH